MPQIMEITSKKDLKCYEKIFDIVRIVDPIGKEIFKFENGEIIPTNIACYSFWPDGRQCEECIGEKVLATFKTYTKIQYFVDKMFLMFALPLKVNEGTYVLELVKDVSHNLTFETIVNNEIHEVRNITQDLNTLILRDPLTNVYNRRFIDQMLPQEIAKCANKNQILSVAMVDLDRFKEINDTYGHAVGDAVIKRISQILSRLTRYEGDWVARYGGDEFLVCLPNTNNRQANKAMERIRQTIEKTCITAEDKKIRITCSLGIYTIKDSRLTAHDLLKCVDEKLYQAKHQGRNRIVS